MTVQVLPSVVTFPPVVPAANDYFLLAALNGSDIPNPSAFRSALGLGNIAGVLRNRFLAAVSSLVPNGLTAFEQYVPGSPDDPLRIAYLSQDFVNPGDTLASGLLSYLTSQQGMSSAAAVALVAQIFTAAS